MSSQTAVLEHRAVVVSTQSVLLPGIALPVIVTNPVECQRLERLLTGDRLVVWWYKPMYSVRNQTHALLRVGCLAKLVHVKKRQHTTYDVLLRGIHRVQLIKPIANAQDTDHWQVQWFTPLDTKATAQARYELKRFCQAVQRLAQLATDVDKPLAEILRSTTDPVALCDVVAAVLIDEPMVQQSILAEPDLSCRSQLLLGYINIALARLSELCIPKALSVPKHLVGRNFSRL